MSVCNIEIPSYYKPYDYKKFWTTKGWDLTFTPTPKGQCLKDSESMHFLRIENSAKGIFQLSRKERYSYLVKEADEYKSTVNCVRNEDFEMYWGETSDSLHERRDLYYTSFYFIKDSIGIYINYTTLDDDKDKLRDYFKMVEKIREKYE